MNPRRLLFYLILSLISGACDDLGIVTLQPEEDNIHEAVLRYQFRENDSGQIFGGVVSEGVRFFALASAELDTIFWWPKRYYDFDDKFMNRFADVQRPTLKYSEIYIDPGRSVYENGTGQKGILFYVGPIRWVTPISVEAEGGFYFGGLDSEGDLFYLTHRGTRWEVDSLKIRHVS